MGKRVSNLEKANKYLESISGIFSDDEYQFIVDSYKQMQKEHRIYSDKYIEFIDACIYAVARRRCEGFEQNNNPFTNMKFIYECMNVEDENVNLVSFSQIDEEDLSYTLNDQAIESFINDLRKGDENDKDKALTNAVFLDILDGLDKNVVAKKYRITKEMVDAIYDERVGFVKSILIYDDRVVFEEVEKREEYPSNVKRITNTGK